MGLAFLSLLLGACAAIYKPAPFRGASGYSSRNIDATTVVVSYLTGTGAHPDKALEYVMYRSAEIALERGFDGFLVLDSRALAVTGRYASPTSATVTVRMFRGVAPERGSWPEGAKGPFDPRLVRERLEGRIQR